jgi:hypothetical protein
MFCDAPVETQIYQAGERIVFFVDEEADEHEMHIEVDYEGAADQFAWVIPVDAPPEVLLSDVALFDGLQRAVAPSFSHINTRDGRCRGDTPALGGGCMSLEIGLSRETAGEPGVVQVFSEEHVGAYEVVTLRADDADALIGWLQANDYDLPPSLSEAMAPYVAEGSWFVALRMAQQDVAGTLEPLALRLPGTMPSIPIRLTAVAAVDDMPISVWVMGTQDHGPQNVPRVVPNPLRFNLTGDPSGTYASVLSEAIDEAGGQAWVTEVVSPVEDISWRFGAFAAEAEVLPLLTESDLGGFYDAVMDIELALRTPVVWAIDPRLDAQIGAPADEDVLYDALAACIDLSEVDPTVVPSARAFWDRPYAYQALWPALGFDVGECTYVILERLVLPKMHIVDRIEASTRVTRMSTALSAEEMTIDPQFAPATYDGELPGRISSSLITHCSSVVNGERATRSLSVGDYEVVVPSLDMVDTLAQTPAAWLASAELPAASVIYALGDDGRFEEIARYDDEIYDAVDVLAAETLPRGGVASCAMGSSRMWPMLWLWGVVWLRRRERSSA